MTRRTLVLALALLCFLTLPLSITIGKPPSRYSPIPEGTYLPLFTSSPAIPRYSFIPGSLTGEKDDQNLQNLASVTPELVTSTPDESSNLSSVSGTATWYCLAGVSRCPVIHRVGMYGAAGPGLRRALGADWRGQTVTVTAYGKSIRVTLIDWCLCRDQRLVDLFAPAFMELAPLSRGIIPVTVSW